MVIDSLIHDSLGKNVEDAFFFHCKYFTAVTVFTFLKSLPQRFEVILEFAKAGQLVL